MGLRALWIAVALGLGGCGDEREHDADGSDASDTEVVSFEPIAGPSVRMDFARPDLFAAPLPSIDVTDAQLAGWPGATAGTFVGDLVALAQGSDGASLAGAITFTLSEPLAAEVSAALPDVATTEGPIVVHPIDDPAARVPVTIHYETDGGPYGGTNVLSALPVQGVPLLPDTDYVASLSRAALGLGRGQALSDLLSGRAVAGLGPDALALYRAGVAASADKVDLAGLTVFRTHDPTTTFQTFVAAARAEPPPVLDDLALSETYDDYCVFTKTVDIPDYQLGDPPFGGPGEGVWTFGPDQSPQRRAPTRLFVTIPRAPAPEAGYPTLVFIRTGGGGDRPLIDRGLRAVAHGEPIVAQGTGPAVGIARAGWAAITWDGPHGGPRNPTGGDEQFLVFNVLNPAATRDNIRQSALEAVVVESWLDVVSIDASACPGATADATLDGDTSAIMGHSMGGWIAPIALAADGADFDAAILSGAGGSWIENIVHKLSPIPVRPLAESLLGYDVVGRTLGAHDPTLTLLQWVGEVADPQAYPPRAPEPHILMIEGIVDTYILPPIANTTALSQRLDLAGEAHDETDPRLGAFVPLASLLPFVGAETIELPASGNRDGATRVVVQSPGDAIEDGHEAMFQTAAPKVQYRCFLADLAAGRVPIVRAVAAEAAEDTSCESLGSQ